MRLLAEKQKNYASVIQGLAKSFCHNQKQFVSLVGLLHYAVCDNDLIEIHKTGGFLNGAYTDREFLEWVFEAAKSVYERDREREDRLPHEYKPVVVKNTLRNFITDKPLKLSNKLYQLLSHIDAYLMLHRDEDIYERVKEGVIQLNIEKCRTDYLFVRYQGIEFEIHRSKEYIVTNNGKTQCELSLTITRDDELYGELGEKVLTLNPAEVRFYDIDTGLIFLLFDDDGDLFDDDRHLIGFGFKPDKKAMN